MSRTLSPEAAASARNKFEELKKLAEQRQLVNIELINKLAKALEKVKAGTVPAGAGPSLIAGATNKQQPSAKRPSQPTSLAAPEAKRPKLDAESEKRIHDIWRLCASVVEFLWKKKNAHWFHHPVDPIKLGIPDYFKYITNPMDLTTVKGKLREKRYNDPREFAADMRLIWQNCFTYNQVGSPVRDIGQHLSDEFERRWAELNVEERWDELMLHRNPEAVSLERRIASSARQLIQRVNSVQALPEADPTRSMSTVEKRKLSIALSELQGDHLGEVLNIIAENLKHLNPEDEEEIELDVDQLDNATLWRLREFCDSVAQKSAGGHKATAPPAKVAGGPGRSSQGNGKQQHQPQSSKPPARTESGSESDRYSAEQDVKGSNMVEQPQSNEGRMNGHAIKEQQQPGEAQGAGEEGQGQGVASVEQAAEAEPPAGPDTAAKAGQVDAEDAGDEDGGIVGTKEEGADSDGLEGADEVAVGGPSQGISDGSGSEQGEGEEGKDDGKGPDLQQAPTGAEGGGKEEDAETGQQGSDSEPSGDEEGATGSGDEEGSTGSGDGDGGSGDGDGGSGTGDEEMEDAEEQPEDEAAKEGQPNFVKNQRSAIPVDESATAPKDKSAIATDKKSNKDVVLNASAWQAADEDPAEGGGEATPGGAGGEEPGDDDLWDSFRSVAETEKQRKAEEEKRRKELEQERERERLRVVAEARQAKEEEERKMREAEEAAAAEAKRAKDEARQKELEELQMQANTAQVYQPPDASAFAQTLGAGGADIKDLGLIYKHTDDDMNFDD